MKTWGGQLAAAFEMRERGKAKQRGFSSALSQNLPMETT
jgi:hypothetical protein